MHTESNVVGDAVVGAPDGHGKIRTEGDLVGVVNSKGKVCRRLLFSELVPSMQNIHPQARKF